MDCSSIAKKASSSGPAAANVSRSGSVSSSSSIGSSGSCGTCCGGGSFELDAGVLCSRGSFLLCCKLLSLVCDLTAVLFSPLGDVGGIDGGSVFGGMLDLLLLTTGDRVLGLADEGA